MPKRQTTLDYPGRQLIPPAIAEEIPLTKVAPRHPGSAPLSRTRWRGLTTGVIIAGPPLPITIPGGSLVSTDAELAAPYAGSIVLMRSDSKCTDSVG